MANPSLEIIVALKPDLVFGTPEANRRETADQLERLGVPLYGATAKTLEGNLVSIEDLGRILGRPAVATKLGENCKPGFPGSKGNPGQPRPKVLFVVRYRPLITVGPTTFIVT